MHDFSLISSVRDLLLLFSVFLFSCSLRDNRLLVFRKAVSCPLRWRSWTHIFLRFLDQGFDSLRTLYLILAQSSCSMSVLKRASENESPKQARLVEMSWLPVYTCSCKKSQPRLRTGEQPMMSRTQCKCTFVLRCAICTLVMENVIHQGEPDEIGCL